MGGYWLINKKDVITMYMPFPDINSALAVNSHMYICRNHIINDYELIKCQTFKNKFYDLNHKIIESANENRNPFRHKTLIDCDKLFKIKKVIISDGLLTKRRKDVSDDLFNEVDKELVLDNYRVEEMNRLEVVEVNRDIQLSN